MAPYAHHPIRSGAILALVALTLLAPGAAAQAGGTLPTPTPVTPQGQPSGTAFDGNGMWIWELARSSGGDPDRIAQVASTHGVSTIYVKSSDGSRYWSQFSPAFVGAMHARGLKVCAWPYVYGNSPRAEARVSARAVSAGADCLVIDAEAEYEGKYTSAGTYVRKLRAYVGQDYPVGLAGFPYVDYHPAFPYSVFLGPGGAQYNVPQMYWRAIGTTVDQVYAHTYAWNALYGRPVFPLGQLWMSPPPAEVVRFRQLAVAYGATGVSWWSWQAAGAKALGALATPLQTLAGTAPAAPVLPTLARGARGDTVVWAQQHLRAAKFKVKASGYYGGDTKTAVRRFQAARALPVTGAIDGPTWDALLVARPAAARWDHAPRSADLPARRRELPPKP
jgi:hypothetical protein